jgi:hypothetical protein
MRLRRGVVIGVAILGVMLLATAAGGVALYQANERLGQLSASLDQRDATLVSVQAELAGVAAALETSRLAIASSEATRAGQSRDLEVLRARLERSAEVLSVRVEGGLEPLPIGHGLPESFGLDGAVFREEQGPATPEPEERLGDG